MKKNIIVLKQKILLMLSLFIIGDLSYAQQSKQLILDDIAKPVTTKGWIDFREYNDLNAESIFTDKKHLFGLSSNDDMLQYKVQSDEIGYTHFRYQQYHKGIKIIGAETILHHNGSYLKSMNGFIASDLNMDVVPAMSKESAFTKSKEACADALQFIWENPEMADALSKSSNGEKDFSKPSGELVICRKNWDGEFNADNLTIAFYYRMIVLPMDKSKDVYIDAKTGEIIKTTPIATNCNNNTGNSTWYGTVNFNAGYFGFPNNAWFLESSCPGEATMRSLRGDPLILYNYGDADGSWTDPNGTNGYNQRAGVTTYYGVHKSYEYFRYVHSRLSYNYSNAQLDAFSEITGGLWLSSAENASWNSVTHHMSFGAGATSSPNDDWNCLDIVAHELSHGMHQFSVGMNYNGEPGALDESFADIFGVCAESYAEATLLPDWLMGNDRGAIRSLSNPNAFFQPDTYLGTFWFTIPGCPGGAATDNCGVHTNSGVQNYWFYLLTVGGSGTNDLGQTFSVSPVGISIARNITYRNMDLYLTSSSGYIDAREGSIRAAADLYGWCSYEVLQVARAWYAVGVASVCPDWNYITPCGTIASGSTLRGINSLATSNSCTTTLPSGSNALFSATATGGVTLNVGFTAAQGSAFTALIDYCNEAAYNLKTASNEVQEAASKSIINTSIEITSVHPNPANQNVTVQFKSSQEIANAQYSISDLSGRKVFIVPESSTENGDLKIIQINTSEFSNGIYLLHINNKAENASCKIVIMH
jgi:Zn-dependent metalloprotease